MSIMTVGYGLSGVVNNTQVNVSGKGEADLETGRYRMSLDVPVVPMHWDPAFVILICCDRMLGVCARQESGAQNIHNLSDGDHLLAWRQGLLYDSQGRECGWAQASSYGHCSGTHMESRSQLLQAHFHLELKEEITKIHTPYRAMMMPFRDNIVLVTSAYTFETNFGNLYQGYTNYPYKMAPEKAGINKLQSLQMLIVEDVQLERQIDETTGHTKLDFEIQQAVHLLQQI